jgi:hypothetical protein
MNILFLGNFSVDFSSESHYRKTFQKMGHNVIAAQEGKISFEDLNTLLDGKIDYFFWVHTHGQVTPGIDSILNKCRERNIVSFAYHLDLYMGIQREKMLMNNSYFNVDHFFTVDALMARWINENKTKTKGHFLPAGVLEEECYIGRPNSLLHPHDIVFTGAKNYHAEWPYRIHLIEWLHATYGDRFAHYGSGGRPQLRGAELNTLYASAKIVIGDTLCKDFKYPFYSSDRLFEVTGRGGFLIYPEIRGLSEFYRDMDDVVYYKYNDFDNLKYLIDYFLKNDSEREVIRNRGHWRAKKEHTYSHRLADILMHLEGEKNKTI